MWNEGVQLAVSGQVESLCLTLVIVIDLYSYLTTWYNTKWVVHDRDLYLNSYAKSKVAQLPFLGSSVGGGIDFRCLSASGSKQEGVTPSGETE